MRVNGVVVRWNEIALVWDEAYGAHYESFRPGAFDRHLRFNNVTFCLAHLEESLGSLRTGELKLTSNDREMRFEMELPNSGIGQDTYEVIKGGLARGMSFQFESVKHTWQHYNGLLLCDISEAILFHVSPVPQGAYKAGYASGGRSPREQMMINKRKLELALLKDK